MHGRGTKGQRKNGVRAVNKRKGGKRSIREEDRLSTHLLEKVCDTELSGRQAG